MFPIGYISKNISSFSLNSKTPKFKIGKVVSIKPNLPSPVLSLSHPLTHTHTHTRTNTPFSNRQLALRLTHSHPHRQIQQHIFPFHDYNTMH